MAILFWSRRQIRDSAGAAVNGGKLRVYNANTTTLSSTYSDATLTTPLANPVVADSLGYLPAIFCAAANYDLAELTAGDVSIRTVDDIPSVGSDESSFSKDFTNSRAVIRGSGGTVHWESGDASPDDTGGTSRFGGWNSTQGDTLSLDYAAVNVTGRMTEQSKKIPGVVYTAATTVSAQATIDITLPNDPSGVTHYELLVWDYVQSGNGILLLRSNHGAGLLSGASDYVAWIVSRPAGSGGTVATPLALNTGTSMQVAGNMNSGTNRLGRLRMEIITANSGNNATFFSALTEGVNNNADYEEWRAFGYSQTAQGRCTAIRLLQSGAATMTCKYLLRTIRGTGD